MRLNLPDTLALLDRLLEKGPQTSKPGGFTIRLRRLRELLAETNSAEPSLAAIAGFVFPGVSPNSLRTTLLEFRKSLSEAADAAGLRISFIRPDARGVDASKVVCHFEGTSIPVIVSSGAEEIALGRENEVIEVRARATKIFISFAVADQKLSKEFTDQLKVNLPLRLRSLPLRFQEPIELWRFDEKGGILPGEDNEVVIRQRMNESQFGILLVSPIYLSRPFIQKVELPHFIGDNAKAHAIPVALADFTPGADKDPLLDSKNVFTFRNRDFYKTPKKERGDFIKALCDHIAELIQKYPAPVFPQEKSQGDELSRFRYLSPDLRKEDGEYIQNLARAEHSLAKSVGTNESIPAAREGVPVLKTLLDWVNSPTDSAYMAVLGEAGAGKTMTCSKLAHELNSRKPGSCIYIDLRFLNESGLLKTNPNPALTQILTAILGRNSLTEKITPETVLKAVREQGALLIWDGLDEILVHVSNQEGEALFSQLKEVLPSHVVRQATGNPGRILIACRTHYFRNFEHEASALTQAQRGAVNASASNEDRARFRVLRLLPFNEEQIRAYLVANMPALDLERAIEVIKKVHNLRDLAERPYCLSLMRASLPDLDQSLAAGKKIRTVDLYRSLVRSWLSRDGTKHRFDEDDKPRLMASLAAHLWGTGGKSSTIEALSLWLKQTIVSDTTYRTIYGDAFKDSKTRDELLQDFRTATFIARWDGDSFRFAHTSLQEYFLACHLVHALETGDLDAWNLPSVNRETLDFAAELFLQRSEESITSKVKLENTLTRLLQQHLPGRSENALAFYLRLNAAGETDICIPQADLRELDLTAWEFEGKQGRPLHLPGSNFSRAKLIRARFHHVELNDSKWNGADLCSAEFVGCDLVAADFSSRDQITCMEGVRIRDCRLNSCQVTGVNAKGLRVDLPEWDEETEATWDAVGLAAHYAPSAMPTPNAQWAFGHGNIVMKVACFPCGSWIASGSLDGTVRIWDATNGDCARNLEGHSDGVNDVAISPDGKLLASAGRDARMIVWEVSSGTQLHSIRTGSDAPQCVCFSGDGKSLFVGGMYEGFHVYKVETGEFIFKQTRNQHSSFLGSVIHVDRADDTLFCSHNIRNFLSLSVGADDQDILFEGHENQLRSISVSPRDPVVASSGDDRIVRIWNKHTGAVISELDYHQKDANVVAFSPDGALLISGSGDGSVCIWDSRSWRNIATFDIGKSVKSVAFFPDGKRLAVASDLSIQIWDLGQRIMLREIRGSHKPTSCIAYSHSGTKLASGTWFGSVSVWDGIQGTRIQRTVPPVSQISSIIFLPGDSDLLFASTNGEIGVIDAADGTTRFINQGHAGAVYALASDSNGSWIASASTDKTVKLWDAKTGAPIRELEQTDQMIKSLFISPDGKWIVGGGSSNHQLQNLVCIWDSSSGKLTTLDKNHLNSVNALAVSPNSRFLASSAFRGEIYCWELGTGVLLHTISVGPRTVSHLGFSADGRHILALSRDMKLRSWDFEKGAPIEVSAEELEHFQKGVMSSGLDLQLCPFVLSSFGTIRPLTSGICELDIYEDRKGNFAVLEKKGRNYQWRLVRANGEYWRYVNYATDGPEERVLWSADVLGPVPEG